MPLSPHTSEPLKPSFFESRTNIPMSQTLPQRSTSSVVAEPGRSGIPRSQTLVQNGEFPPRVIPRLMSRLGMTRTNIFNYPTAINRRQNSQNSSSAEPAIDQQSCKCEKHTEFAANSFAVRHCDPCQRILTGADRQYAEHILAVLIVRRERDVVFLER